MSTNIEKALAMRPRDLIGFAKSGGLSKQDLFVVISDLAEAQRQRGESRDQAFSAFVTQNQDGIDLFAIQKGMPARDVAVEKPAPVAKSGVDSWAGMIGGLQRSLGITFSKAVDMALQTPEGQKLFQKTRQEQVAKGDETPRATIADAPAHAATDKPSNFSRARWRAAIEAWMSACTCSEQEATDALCQTKAGKEMFDRFRTESGEAASGAGVGKRIAISKLASDPKPTDDDPDDEDDLEKLVTDIREKVVVEAMRKFGVSRAAAVAATKDVPIDCNMLRKSLALKRELKAKTAERDALINERITFAPDIGKAKNPYPDDIEAAVAGVLQRKPNLSRGEALAVAIAQNPSLKDIRMPHAPRGGGTHP